MLFAIDSLGPREIEVAARIATLRDSLRYVTQDVRRWTGLLRRSSFARAIRGSNSIEGYTVSNEDAIAAVESEAALEADTASWRAVTGYREAMTYIVQLSDDPHFSYSEALLRGLHYMMLKHELAKHPGRWRPGAVYVRNETTGEVVYEGPDVGRIPALVHELVEELNRSSEQPAIVRAALAHLNLAMIHPFSDGNGRMARALQTLVLAREGILAPEFCSIEEYLGRNADRYEAVLAKVGQGRWRPANDARPWVRFCLTGHLNQGLTLVRRAQESARVWEELEVEVARRRLPERTVLALYDAAFGYRVRNSTYRSAAEISLNLASRDLKALADAGLLVARGERRGRTYAGSETVRSMRERSREPAAHEDPFAAS